jgi:hypothetical protein
MLDRKSQSFDLQEIGITQKSIYIDRKGVSSEFGIQTSTQAPKSMGMVLFNIELF